MRVIKYKRLGWAGHVARMKEGAFKILTSTPTGKRPLGRPCRGWEDNRMDLKEMGINTRNSVYSAQDGDYWKALVNVALILQVHK